MYSMKSTSFLLSRIVTISCLGACSLAFASCGGGNGDGGTNGGASEGLSLKQLVIALKASEKPEEMLAEQAALEEYLQEKLDRRVKVIVPTSSDSIGKSFRNGTLDVCYLNSTDAARNVAQATAYVLLANLENGKPHYKSIWLSLKGKDYGSVEELAGKPVAFAKRISASGFLIPAWDLSKRGLVGPDKALTDFFSQTIYGTGGVSVVRKVLRGEVEAAAMSENENENLSDEWKAKLKVVQEQGPVPTDVICCRHTLSPADREIIRNSLLAMNEDNPELRDKVFHGELAEVNPKEHLKITLEALKVEETLKQ